MLTDELTPCLPLTLCIDYHFALKDKVPTPAGLMYIWVASRPSTACANGASLSAYLDQVEATGWRASMGQAESRGKAKEWAWRLFQFNVSQDCRYRVKLGNAIALYSSVGGD